MKGNDMSCKLNKKAYVKLIEEDAEWLRANTEDCLEQDHILQVLSHSVHHYYPEPKKRSWIVKVVDVFGLSNHG